MTKLLALSAYALACLVLIACGRPSATGPTTHSNGTRTTTAMTPATGPAHPAACGWNRELRVAEPSLWPLPGVVEFTLRGIWRYDPGADRWERVLKATMPLSVTIKPVQPQPGPGAPSRRIL